MSEQNGVDHPIPHRSVAIELQEDENIIKRQDQTDETSNSPTSPALKAARRCWQHCSAAIFSFVGSIFYFFGSILYYPSLVNAFGVQNFGPIMGGWFFELGSLFFLLACIDDVLGLVKAKTDESVHKEKSTTWEPWFNWSCYCLGATTLVIGSVFFIFEIYVKFPSVGCYLFILGCSLYMIGAVGDIFLHVMQTGNQVTQKLLTTVLESLCTVLGALLFVVGCYYFLPENLVSNGVWMFAVHNFVFGSIFFGMVYFCASTTRVLFRVFAARGDPCCVTQGTKTRAEALEEENQDAKYDELEQLELSRQKP